MIRFVFDTNTIVSALLSSNSVPKQGPLTGRRSVKLS